MELSRQERFSRTERLLGADGLARLAQTRVIIFGVGGVGSWCAESLVRSGVGGLTMVDPDVVQASNINRQLMATTSAVGQPKAEVLRRRLLDINPEADIRALCTAYAPDRAADFDLGGYDYVVDAIDSLEAKAHLLCAATAAGARVFASMGAALKLDPQRIRVAEFWKVQGCPLAAALPQAGHAARGQGALRLQRGTAAQPRHRGRRPRTEGAHQRHGGPRRGGVRLHAGGPRGAGRAGALRSTAGGCRAVARVAPVSYRVAQAGCRSSSQT